MQNAIFIFGVVVVCFLLVYAIDQLLPTGWGIFSQKFYDDMAAASVWGKIAILMTIIAGVLMLILGAALYRGHI
jgi:uncharacterized membrane protein